MAYKHCVIVYDLLLQNDVNTNGNTQWFNFKVSNTKKDLKIKFNIKNFCKDSFALHYNNGMKIFVKSKKESSNSLTGWKAAG